MNNYKIYWFTGQPGAGKTVLSTLLRTTLEKTQNNKVFHVDGDDLRNLFNNQRYGIEGRIENIKRAQDISKFILNQGHDVVVSLVAPYKELRENFKKELGKSLVEIYVHTTEVRGREHYHISEYEKPTDNYIDIDTTKIEPNFSLEQILKKL